MRRYMEGAALGRADAPDYTLNISTSPLFFVAFPEDSKRNTYCDDAGNARGCLRNGLSIL